MRRRSRRVNQRLTGKKNRPIEWGVAERSNRKWNQDRPSKAPRIKYQFRWNSKGGFRPSAKERYQGSKKKPESLNAEKQNGRDSSVQRERQKNGGKAKRQALVGETDTTPRSETDPRNRLDQKGVEGISDAWRAQEDCGQLRRKYPLLGCGRLGKERESRHNSVGGKRRTLRKSRRVRIKVLGGK